MRSESKSIKDFEINEINQLKEFYKMILKDMFNSERN